MTETLTFAAILIPCLIVAIVFHEVAHGYAALMLGDTTARDRNRLSLNPLRHVDPVGTLLVPGFLALASGPVFGWAKPVPVVQSRLDNPRFGMMAVAAAGPAANIVLGTLGAIAFGLTLPEGAAMLPSDGGMPMVGDAAGVTSYLSSGLFFFILINVFLAIFNLLPIPPFDGSHIVEGLLPPSLAQVYVRLRPYGMALFFGLIALTWFVPEWGVLETIVGPPVSWTMDQFLTLAGQFSG